VDIFSAAQKQARTRHFGEALQLLGGPVVTGLLRPPSDVLRILLLERDGTTPRREASVTGSYGQRVLACQKGATANT
jgi:hypothetical protein